METIQSISGKQLPGVRQSQASTQKTQAGEKNLKKLETACKEMESLFVQEMLKSMRRAVAKSELFHGGRAEEIYTSLYDQQISQKIVEADGVGLYRMLYDQLKERLPESK